MAATNRRGVGANTGSRLGRIFDAAAEACAVEETILGALVAAIDEQAPRHRLRLETVRTALAAHYYGGGETFASEGFEAYPHRVMERTLNRMPAQRRAGHLRSAADFYRGGN